MRPTSTPRDRDQSRPLKGSQTPDRTVPVRGGIETRGSIPREWLGTDSRLVRESADGTGADPLVSRRKLDSDHTIYVYVGLPATKPGDGMGHHIGRRGARTLLHAPRTARAIGRPLNVYVTIRLWQLGSDEWTAAKAARAIRSSWFGRWSRRAAKNGACPENGPPTHTGVVEAEGGVHMHWMLHVRTENLEWFIQSLTARLKRQFGLSALPEGALDVRMVTNDEGLKLYFAKSVDPRYGRAWGIRPGAGGHVSGRRVWTSLNLGPAHWMPRRDAYRAARRAG